MNDLDRAMAVLVNPFVNDTMHTLPGIMLKAALNDLGEWWGESALADVSRLAAETFDSLLAILDRMDGDADREDGGEAEPAPIVAERSGGQVVSPRRPAEDLRPSAPESVLQDMPAAPTVLAFAPLPWRGAGNVVAAAGVALLDMVARR